MTPLQSAVASEASTFSLPWQLGHRADWVGILAQQTGCFFFRGRGVSCQHPFPIPKSQVHFCLQLTLSLTG